MTDTYTVIHLSNLKHNAKALTEKYSAYGTHIGIVKGDALDCSTCNGDCSGCGGTCKNPQIKLSKEQLQELDELDRKYGVSR